MSFDGNQFNFDNLVNTYLREAAKEKARSKYAAGGYVPPWAYEDPTEIELDREKAVRVRKPTGIDPATTYLGSMFELEKGKRYMVVNVDPEGLTEERLDTAPVKFFNTVLDVINDGWIIEQKEPATA